jgi:116 kDa U5 small nuclear ribonucleoprotein component
MQAQDGGATPVSQEKGGALMEVDSEDEAAEEYYKHGHQIVLHEDKQYYPDAEQVFGKGVETLVMEEDA